MQNKRLRAFPLKDWEVRAVMANIKTEKRIPIKPQPVFQEGETGIPEVMDDGRWQFKIQPYKNIWDFPIYPRYQKGDILYVQETWGNQGGTHFLYRADFHEGETSCESDSNKRDLPKWNASTQMPWVAARLFIRVTDVRVEKIQDITADSCTAEGIQKWSKDGKLVKYYPADFEGDYPACEWQNCPKTPQLAMKKIWDKPLKGTKLDLYGWDANPWVLVYVFEKVSKKEALQEVNVKSPTV